MNPNTQELPLEIQEALSRRQGQPAQGAAQNAPQAAPVDPSQAATPTPAPPPMPPDPAQGVPTPQMPFDPSEIKMIEGALINRLKALTEAQFPESPEQVQMMGGQ